MINFANPPWRDNTIRKHTGEVHTSTIVNCKENAHWLLFDQKPYKCIVPECNKMFSRFDNMMQHTQTHRSTPDFKHHHYSQRRRKPSASLTINTTKGAKFRPEESLISPVSLPSTCSSSDGEDQRRRRCLSIADLCNPSSSQDQPANNRTDVNRELSQDEVEALQAFGRLHRTAPDFFESLKNLVCDTADHRPCACL